MSRFNKALGYHELQVKPQFPWLCGTSNSTTIPVRFSWIFESKPIRKMLPGSTRLRSSVLQRSEKTKITQLNPYPTATFIIIIQH